MNQKAPLSKRSARRWAISKPIGLLLVILLGICLPGAAAAQTPELDLSLRRDFGYGLGGDIEGTFTLSASSANALTRVEFLIDGEVFATSTTAPFRVKFRTDQFDPGLHELSARGYDASGAQYAGEVIRANFLSAEQMRAGIGRILLPLGGILLGIFALAIVVQLLTGKRNRFRPGIYGAAGGAICRRCELPFSRSLLALNLPFGKLERCPHCGKWAVVRAANQDRLRAAEARYQQANQPEQSRAPSKEAGLERLLDDSRFDSSL